MSTSNTQLTSIRNRSLLGSSLVIAALMACAAVAHAQTPVASTSVEKTEKTVEKAVSDSWITTKVKSEILANSVSKAFKVNVKTKGGVVTMKGELPTQDSIDLVKMIAEKVKGVKGVDVSGLTKVG